MAEASKRYADGAQDGAVLYLNKDEADTLAAILAPVAGSSSTSPRRHRDAIARALEGAGYSWGTSEAYKLIVKPIPTVYFLDYPRSFEAGHFMDTGDHEIRWIPDAEAMQRAEREAVGEWKRVTVTEAE